MTLKGIVHGKIIELEADAGLPDGQQVSVVLEIAPPASAEEDVARRREALRRAFGGWADEGDAVDEFLREVRRDRDAEARPDLDA